MKIAKIILAGTAVLTLISSAAFAQQGLTGTVTQVNRINRTVAIKQTLFPDDPRHISRFEQEAELLAQVEHDALPRI